MATTELPSWLAQIEAVEKKLQRLGSVNLAALQEYEEQLQRKQFCGLRKAPENDKSLSYQQ